MHNFCDFFLSFDRLPHFKVHLSSIRSFVSDSAIGMDISDFKGSIQQPLVDREVVLNGDFSSEEIHHEAFDDESSSYKRLVDPHYVSRGTSRPHRRVRPSTAPLDKELGPITTILPCYPRRGV